MGGSEIAAQFLVDHDTARERVRRRRNHENDGAPVAKDRVYDVKGLFKRSQQDARDSGLVEELEIVVLLGSSAVAVGEKELQLSLSCRRLGPARDVDEERVPNVDQDQADSICSSCGERPGSAIADKAQFGNRCFDLEPGLFGDYFWVVEHVRHGADRDTGATSDVLNARCTPPGVAVIGVTGPSSRLRHAGRLYPDSCVPEAVQPSHRTLQGRQ